MFQVDNKKNGQFSIIWIDIDSENYPLKLLLSNKIIVYENIKPTVLLKNQ